MSKPRNNQEQNPCSSGKDETEDNAFTLCPVCDGAAEFKMINPETQTVTVIVCKGCNGERVILVKHPITDWVC